MNKPKHSKGPWEAAFTEETALITAPALCGNGHRFDVARCDRTNDNSDANARLIAAAPDLLKALQEMVAVMRAMSDKYQEGVMPFSCEDAEKLIAKFIEEGT